MIDLPLPETDPHHAEHRARAVLPTARLLVPLTDTVGGLRYRVVLPAPIHAGQAGGDTPLPVGRGTTVIPDGDTVTRHRRRRLLLVLDGRQPGHSVGTTTREHVPQPPLVQPPERPGAGGVQLVGTGTGSPFGSADPRWHMVQDVFSYSASSSFTRGSAVPLM